MTTAASATSLAVDHLCDFDVALAAPQMLTSPLGVRLISIIEGGTVEGPRLRGTFLPGGGDWMLAGTDRVGRLDVRATIRTHDDALVHLTVAGRFRLDDEAMSRLYAGETVREAEMYGRTTPLFDTGAEAYAWLNSTVTVAFNEVSLSRVRYRVYALR
ncbi:DUF3237 domain-containing protein [Micromonospora sp. NPDC126480]|uniref:DUF3237 domain-containing protein n=1 Tax=Micromonospora sp. NPDC126480 TaxID=3155312 RepID=UPI00332767FC